MNDINLLGPLNCHGRIGSFIHVVYPPSQRCVQHIIGELNLRGTHKILHLPNARDVQRLLNLRHEIAHGHVILALAEVVFNFEYLSGKIGQLYAACDC